MIIYVCCMISSPLVFHRSVFSLATLTVHVYNAMLIIHYAYLNRLLLNYYCTLYPLFVINNY